MDLDLQWLLIGLPVVFALGWLASRMDLRQLRRESRDAPRAYYKGLNLLLNEQQDKAIDAFIEAVQHDPDTTELHFALGNLFRRRGEFERAVRVHQHLLARADLASRERDRAQHALAQDYLRAGLFDRAEQAYGALRGSAFDLQARLALLSIHERARDWLRAADMAAGLDSAGESSYAVRRSHHFCEASLEADARGDATAAQDLLARAHEAAPGAVRPWVLTGQRLWRLGQAAQAMAAWDRLHAMQSPAFALVAADYVAAARACGRTEEARHLLSASYSQHPGIDLLRAWGDLDGKDSAGHVGRLTQHLARQPSLAAASDMLERPPEAWGGEGLKALRDAIAQAARPMQRYRCAACGFEAHHHFWQCPGCLHWDSYPPQRIEEL